MLTNEQLSAFNANGYVIVHDLLGESEIEEFLAYEDRPHPERSGTEFLQIHRVDPLWERMAKHPNIAGRAAQLIGGDAKIVQTMYLKKPPSGVGIALHQDTHYIPNDPNTLVACWVALTDTDAGNGGFCVAPGTHTGPLLSVFEDREDVESQQYEAVHTMRDRSGREWQQRIYRFHIDLPEDRIERLTIPRGAGIFFHGMLVHGSFANHSEDRLRLAFATHYVRADTWLLRTDLHDAIPLR